MLVASGVSHAQVRFYRYQNADGVTVIDDRVPPQFAQKGYAILDSNGRVVEVVPRALTEAATAFGATPRQLLWKVELPSALPQIMAGLNQTIMLSLSMVVIAALVGANGLGVPVVRALNSVNTALGFESGFIIVVVAILLDRSLRVTRK